MSATSLRVRDICKQLREQVAQLTIDANEHKSICLALERRVQEHRESIGAIVEGVSDEYSRKRDREQELNTNSVRETEARYESLMREKNQLLLESKQVMDEINSTETEIGNLVRTINKSLESKIERERRLFSDARDERMQKVMSMQAFTVKEQTSKAVQPEISRLQQLHERELTEAELAAKANELIIRQEFQSKLRVAQENERNSWKEEQKSRCKSVLAEMNREIEDIDKGHRKALDELDSTSNREHLRLRNVLEARNDKEKLVTEQQVFRLKQQTQSKLQSLVLQHAQNLKDLRITKSDAVDDTTQLEDFPNRSLSADVDSGIDTSSLTRDRDKRIQNEIKAIQAENVRIERSIKINFEKARSNLASTSETEAQALLKSLNKLREQISECTITRHQLESKLKSHRSEFERSKDIFNGIQKELSIYEDGIEMYHLKTEESEQEVRRMETDRLINHANSYSALQERVNTLRQAIDAMRSTRGQSIVAVKSEHNSRLQELDAQVKAELEAKDGIISLLLEDIEIENIKIKKLDSLVQKYKN